MSAKPSAATARVDFIKQPAHLPDGRVINYYWFTLPPLEDPQHPQAAAGLAPATQADPSHAR